jgi:hypothetical protein
LARWAAMRAFSRQTAVRSLNLSEMGRTSSTGPARRRL